MAQDKEVLMYVGGKPKKEGEPDNRPDWQKKWDEVVSGKKSPKEAIKELGDSFTEGDIEALRTCKIGKVVGFSEKINKMRVLTVHVGYPKKEIESPEFQDYMKRTKAEVENTYGKKNIELGFHIPDEETPTISSYGFEHIILSDPEELAVLKKRLQKEQCGVIDIVDVRINPNVAGRDYFGLGGESCTTPGPVKNSQGEYHLPYKAIVEHEIMHCISGNTMKHNPTYFGDGYFRNLYDGEARSILGGHHQEFIPADNDGKPIAGGSETMKKVLAATTPKDENVFMVARDGTKHRLLVVNSGENIMRGSFNNSKRAAAIKNGTYISPAQKIAIADVIKDYLVGEKRLEKGKALQKPKMVVKNSDSKNQTAVKIAQKLGKGQRV